MFLSSTSGPVRVATSGAREGPRVERARGGRVLGVTLLRAVAATFCPCMGLTPEPLLVEQQLDQRVLDALDLRLPVHRFAHGRGEVDAVDARLRCSIRGEPRAESRSKPTWSADALDQAP